MEIYSDGMKDALAGLLGKTGAKTAMLVSREGYNVVEVGDVSYFNTTALAALVAGAFSATREMARMVGEKGFSILLQQGESRHIHISLIQDLLMLVVIFTDNESIGRVRYEARKTSMILADQLAEKGTRTHLESRLEETDFGENAMNLIDRVFQT